MSLTKEKKSELIGKYGRADGDTGSAEVQVALLTERINELTEHLRDARQRSPLAPRPADAGRQAPPHAALPRAAPTSSATAPWSPISACVDDRRRRARPPTSPSATRTAKRSRSPTSGPQGAAGLLPDGLQPGLLATSSRSTRRSSRRSRRRASSWSGSASTAPSPTRPSRRSSASTPRCSPTSSPRARSPAPTAPTSTSSASPTAPWS